MLRSSFARRIIPAFLPITPVSPSLRSTPISSKTCSTFEQYHPNPFLTNIRLRNPSRHHQTQPTMQTTSSQPLPTTSTRSSVVGRNPIFAQCMLRITDPTASKNFYEALGMTQLTRFDFPDFKFSLFFYAYVPANAPSPPSQKDLQSDRAKYLWSVPYPTIELTWNWPEDTFENSVAAAQGGNKGDEVYVTGNEDPKGFGHISINVKDLPSALAALESAGISIVDKPFLAAIPGYSTAAVVDPDGYRVELTGPMSDPPTSTPIMKELDPVLSGIMLRVKDPRSAVAFFSRIGMQYLTRVEDDKNGCTNYYMGYSAAKDMPGDDGSNEQRAEWVGKRRECLLQVVHAWGTEDEAEQIYANGNVKPNRGFGHIGIIIDDIYQSMESLEKDGYRVVRKPNPFADVGDIAFIAEPSTDYWVEIIKREGTPAAKPYEQPIGAIA